MYEYWKHLSTLSTGSIILLAAFLEKLFIQPRWGLSDVEIQKRVNVQDVLKQIQELSQGPVGTNRTFIYVELRKISREPIARQILNLIEPVTQGEKEWAVFQREIDQLLKDIKLHSAV